MPFTTEISGLGGVQYTGSGYTNSALVQAFFTSLSEFYQVKTGTSTLTATDVQNIQNQINFLTEVAKNGVSINLDSQNSGNPSSSGSDPGSSPNVIYFMTTDMVDVLDRLFKSLAPNGNLSAITLSDLNNFRNGTTTQNTNDIQNIFVYAARLFAVLPPITTGAASSAISTDPTTAASQITRIYVPGKTYTASTINGSVTRSIQAFTEMEYVNTANEVINQKLVDLKAALQTTKSSLDNLNQLQQLHNNIIVNSRTFTLDLLNPPSGASGISMNDYITRYEKYASSQLKTALVPQLTSEFLPYSLPASAVTISTSKVGSGLTAKWTFTLTLNDPSKYYAFNTSTNTFLSTVPTTFVMSGYYVSSLSVNPSTFTQAQIAKIVGDGYNGVQKFPLLGTLSAMSTLQLQMTRQRGSLSALLVSLASTTPASVLNDPLKRSQALIGQVSAVYSDLVNNLGSVVSTSPVSTAKVGIRSWIMDNYQTFASSSATSAGKIQQNLTNAITSAQSTNDTQKEDVRNSLLVFEEYYKSAAAVLTQLNQLITKMAQGISR